MVDEELNHFLETVLCTVKNLNTKLKKNRLTNSARRLGSGLRTVTDGNGKVDEPDILSVKRLDLVW